MTFLAAVASALGDDAVLPPDEVARVSASLADWGRSLPGVVRATSIDQVQAILKLAAAHGASIAPWSQGRNWGYGTRLTPNPETFGLDLSGLAAIRAYNPQAGTITVEPGVTQQQAAEWLRDHHAEHYLDVTGAAPTTSIVGNTLERGVAYNSLRADALRHLEVVLADGRLLRTGFGWLESSEVADGYRYGIGPNLTELFLQSNLGIVTAMTVALRPIPERRIPLRLALRHESDISPLLERLARLKQQLKLDAIFHIANRDRTVSTLAPMIRAQAQASGLSLDRDEIERLARTVVPAGWAALGQVEGTDAHCRIAFRTLRRELRAYCSVRSVEPSTLRRWRWVLNLLGFRRLGLVLDGLIELSNLPMGQPIWGPMRGVYWPQSNDEPQWMEPEYGRSGWLLLAPLFPPWDGHVERVGAVIREEAQQAGVQTGITYNLLTPQLAQAIVSVSWSRDEPGATERAHACQQRASERLLGLGYPPYRAALGEMGLLEKAGPDFFEVTAHIKHALDPKNLIAPGRYIPER